MTSSSEEARLGLASRISRASAAGAARQVIGVAVGFAGTALLIRAIGPASYGAYAAAWALTTTLQNAIAGGVAIHLAQRERAGDDVWDHAFAVTGAVGVVVALVAAAFAPLLERWIGAPGLAGVAAVVLATTPVQVVTAVAAARLDRDFAWRHAMAADLAPQFVFVFVALPVAAAWPGPWAPVAGLWASQALRLATLVRLAGVRLALPRDLRLIRQIVREGAVLGASHQAWHLRHLVSPLVVGPLLGPEAVAHVVLAHKLVESVGFFKNGTWRVALASVAHADAADLRGVVERGQRLQILALGPLLVVSAWAAPAAVPWIFGADCAPAASLLPWLGAAALTHALFAMHAPALYALGGWADVLRFQGLHVALFAVAAWALVGRYGIVGYAWGEGLSLVAYALASHALSRRMGAIDSRVATLWWCGGVAALVLQAWSGSG